MGLKMKNLILFLLLFLNVILYSQILTESFNNFRPSIDANTVLDQYTGRSDSILIDYSSFGNNLSFAGWANIGEIRDSMAPGNIIVAGDSLLKFNGIDEYLYISGTSDTLLDPETNDYSVVIIFKTNDQSSVKWLIHKLDPSSPYTGWGIAINSNEGIYSEIKDTDNDLVFLNASTQNGSIGYNIFIMTIKTDSIRYYINGKFSDNLDATLIDTIATGANFVIGARGTSYAKFELISARIYKRALSPKEIKEFSFLARSWYSKNGGVYRNNWGWYQGIVGDTIYTAIPNSTVPANRQAILSFVAWGQNGGEMIKPYTLNWDGGQSITVTNQKKKYTIYMGAMDFSSDSLYFAVPAATDTVYIDNVKLEYRRIDRFGSWRSY